MIGQTVPVGRSLRRILPALGRRASQPLRLSRLSGAPGDREKELIVLSKVNLLETAPDRIDDVTPVVRGVVHPGMRGEGGYVGLQRPRSPEGGKGVTLWESGEAG
jgi:hypothetical protein